MTRLYFIRHGESEANLSRVFSNRMAAHGLTDTGRAQVSELADKLVGIPFAAFYSSPILRARQSADILAERLGIAYTVTPALAEYDVGVLDGRSDEASWEEYYALHEAWATRWEWDAKHPGGESYNEVCARFSPLLDAIRASPPPGPALLLGHGGTFYCALSRWCSNVDAAFAFKRGLGHTEIVIAELNADGLTCESWGDPGQARASR